MEHIPVMPSEVMQGLDLAKGDVVMDATTGAGGHSRLILEAIGKEGTLIAFDRDTRNIEIAKENLAAYLDQIQFIHDSFGNVGDHDLPKLNGVLFDLGYSSMHVDEAQRGFSFQKDGPLDMRYDQNQALTAEEIVNGWSKEELAALFREYGEERFSQEIAKAIFDARRKERIETTGRLAEVISSVIYRKGKTHPATQVFQALRIKVNDEFGEIKRGIDGVIDALAQGGRLAVITFHSLEDRLVKNLLKDDKRISLVNKKVIQPHYKEKQGNPRARSAKLRIAEKK